MGISTSARGGWSIDDEGTSSKASMFLEVLSHRLAKPIWNSFFLVRPLLDMSRPSGRDLNSVESRRGCDGILGEGVWGHAVIFAGDRRLTVRKGVPRSRIRMVEGCTDTLL